MAISKTSTNSIRSFSRFDNTAANTPSTAGSVFLMVGTSTSSTAYATSSDGITWTARSNTGFGSDPVLVRANNAWNTDTGYYLADPVAGSSVANGTNAQTIPSGLGKPFYVAGQWSYGGNATQAGWVWGAFYGGNQTNMLQVAYGNGVWVSVNPYNSVSYRTDATGVLPFGGNYTTATIAITSPERVAFGNGVFVVSGSNGLMTSANGSTWTQTSSAGNFQSARLFFSGGRFWASVGNGAGAVYSSVDGTTWTALSGVSAASAVVGATYGNGMYVLLLANGTLYSSPDATTWTSRTNPVAGTWQTTSNKTAPSAIQFG